VVISLRWQPHETAGDVLAAVGDVERVQNMHDDRDEVLESTLDELGLPSVRLHHHVDFEVVGDDVRRSPRPNARARQRAERRP
jgi:hypothetical protein